VRPEEAIDAKVAGLYGQMTSPVLTDLKLTTTGDVKLNDVLPTGIARTCFQAASSN
jgi:Ca-activated chloride channel family protein